MSKTAFVFPGQGSQSVGMGKELYDNFTVAKAVFEEADEALGFSITDLCFNGPEEALMKTYNTQPAILTVSVACYRVLKEAGLNADIVAGHSLGEYSALVAAGALSFQDAVVLVHKRGQFMQQAVPFGEGSMAAILGMDRSKIIEICKAVEKQGNTVQAVNFNCPGQVVIAGKTEAVLIAVDEMKKEGAKRAVQLPVSAPFHSTLMKPAADKLAAELDKITVQNAEIPVVANINGEIVTQGNDIRASLVRQAASPVLWEDCVAQMLSYSADVFIEVGPGKVLTGFTKKISKESTTFNVEDVASLQKTLDYFKEVR
ncbi:MAG: fabD [Firmicutes bacterium]|nr:fabD [Bacillota bacterium]